ncbi:hypothetical protein ADIS_1919 [Lunatimonas lonarensis]|uniref:Uncharacterized protein n=1 Tax=Lunatimonas lonarensis TaxID=1232681 RepID=R7ZU82_9BACT|nr:hypothetical protein [Lunatimonas lonarensis]EON77700.1 hypothetical protein ADIS_1919 [Lunatimonas lonarensis]
MTNYKTDGNEYMGHLQEQLVALKNTKGRVGISDLEEIVINFACFEILELRRNGVEDLFIETNIINSITKAASQLVPQYDDSHAAIAKMQIPMNCDWEGMWEHLKRYYLNNFNTSI